jgi:transposase
MDVIVERCCGLDVHQETVVACLLTGAAGGRTHKEIRTFRTFTADLEALRTWLTEAQCQQVGMESTGVYWVPVYEVLEGGAFSLVVGNAAHIKNVPGRKTDVKDAEWLARLLRAGLIRKSYVPDAEIRRLRKLVRYRRTVVEARTDERNRLQRQLELCNIKLACVASDVFGKSGWQMLKALVKAEQTPAQMADLAKGTLRNKTDELTLALQGRLDDEDRWILQRQIGRLESLDAEVATIDGRIDERLAPHRAVRQRLSQIPGVSSIVAAVILAEIGVTVDAFPSAGHLAKWAGLCPGNNESAGKRGSSRISGGNPFLRAILVEAAQAAVRKKGSYYKDKFHKIKARRGYKRALVAIAHKLLVAVYHIIGSAKPYRELGETYLDHLQERRVIRNHVARLEALGYQVSLSRPTAPEVHSPT